MELSLAGNIRAFRKQKGRTQEQLAEVLGVTAGAVHKWESGQSLPELGLIVEMADFFDTSVDALLGYQMKDNRPEAALKRMTAYCRSGDREALAEAEKALKKYPNSFEVVLGCAGVYAFFGVGEKGGKETRRALELLERALPLLPQNTDPKISELTIFGEMAGVYLLLGELEKGVSLLKQHNVQGIFSDMIGVNLAMEPGRAEEAEPFLAEALLQSCGSLLDTVVGYVFLFSFRGDVASAEQILRWGMEVLEGLRREDTGFTTKIDALMNCLLAHLRIKTGQTAEARTLLEKAAALAARFDAAPDYSLGSFRFTKTDEVSVVRDSLGATAAESIGKTLRLLRNEELSELWKEVGKHD